MKQSENEIRPVRAWAEVNMDGHIYLGTIYSRKEDCQDMSDAISESLPQSIIKTKIIEVLITPVSPDSSKPIFYEAELKHLRDELSAAKTEVERLREHIFKAINFLDDINRGRFTCDEWNLMESAVEQLRFCEALNPTKDK